MTLIQPYQEPENPYKTEVKRLPIIGNPIPYDVYIHIYISVIPIKRDYQCEAFICFLF